MRRILVVILLLCQSFLISAQTPREALKQLYKATNGKHWHRHEGWLSRKPLSEWEGITCNDNGEVVKIELSKNNLQGKLPDIFGAFPALEKLLLRDNSLCGELPPSLAQIEKRCRIDVRGNCLSTTTLYAPRECIDRVARSIICYPQQESHHDFRLFVDCDIDKTAPQGYHPDGYCRIYQKATEGAGVDIFIIGDGYDKAEYAVGGTADYWLERAAEAIFEIEPYKKLRPLFNVYIIYAYSPERGVGLFDNERISRFGYWQRKPTQMSNAGFNRQEVLDVCKQGLESINKKVPTTLYVAMVVNSTNTGLYRGMMYGRRIRTEESGEYILRVALNPTNPKTFNSLVWHEFGGHCFGGLRDEYVPKKGEEERLFKGKKLSANLDTESNPKLVKWAQFIEDSRYAHEKIGVYRGGYKRYHNVYRATETSIMRRGGNSKLRFNAPSRAEIYRKTMELAYPGWKFDYEEFVKFDLEGKR